MSDPFNFLVVFLSIVYSRDLKKALLNLGQKYDDTEIQDLVKICDFNGDNMIDFQEFSDMMQLRYIKTVSK